MTLELSNSPNKPEIKTWFDTPPMVHIRGVEETIEITMQDFCHAMYYALVNTPLSGDEDPRLVFLKVLGRMERRGDKFFYKSQEMGKVLECWSLQYPGGYRGER